MKQYGLSIDGYGSRYVEHRILGSLAGFALGGLFAEFWIITLGLAFFVFCCLAEIWGSMLIKISLLLPLGSVLWFVSAILTTGKIYPASMLFGIICFMIILKGPQAPSIADSQ